jgi:hypothetical protein
MSQINTIGSTAYGVAAFRGFETTPDRRPVWRAYYNVAADAPFVWSVDEGTTATERRVRAIVIDGAVAVSRYDLSRDNVANPRAWFEIEGTLEVTAGLAKFSA